MVQWVWESASRARLATETVVATDDERIARVVHEFGGVAVLTSGELVSGTDRVAAVARERPADIYVNVQGDEPMIQPEGIDRAIELVASGKFSMSTLMTRLKTVQELNEPSVVKVIPDHQDRAIYFSRFAIPYSRENPSEKPTASPFICYRHIGLYVYNKETLLRLQALPPTPMEKAESLEQLRALYNGISIGCAEVQFTSIGVDTPEDLEKVRLVLNG